MNRNKLRIIAILLLFAASCKVLPTKPYLAKQAKIDFTPQSKLTKEEKDALRTRLFAQQDDSVKVTIKENLFVFKTIVNPIVYDTAYSSVSARNMEASLRHLGYYQAKVIDSAIYKKKTKFFRPNKNFTEVQLKYLVNTGITTRIDTFAYRLKIPELQQIAIGSFDKSYIKKNDPVTKTAVLSEIARLVDSFRNNGYYKFTASELRMRGDSSVSALTNLSDDPIEQLEALIEAQKKRDSPTIKLALVIIKPEDTTKLNKYFINKIYILSDYRQGDNVANLDKYNQVIKKDFKHLFHQNLFKTSLLERNLTLHSGNVFRQTDFYTTLNNLTKLAVWQNVNIRLIENLDEQNKLDVVIELTPSKKLTPALTLDLNYSAAGSNNNGISGNLFGTSLNLSLENKNFAKEAIKMFHNFRFGIEFKNKKSGTSNNLIQSNEVSYSNDVNIPRMLIPFRLRNVDPRYWFYKINSPKSAEKKYITDKAESFINTNFSYSNRLDLFNLQNVGLSLGYRSKNAKNNIFTFKPLSAAFSKLYNESDTFIRLLSANPYLRYSYNTSFTIGVGVSYSSKFIYPKKKTNNTIRELDFKISGEESGLTWGLIKIKDKKEVKKSYIKFDTEIKYSETYSKNVSLNLRSFLGVGIPLKGNEALPFFKQFAGGGSSSMRGWPIRGIGRGGQPLASLNGQSVLFNDRTGDIQLELNAELRHPIIKIYTELITLRGALFVDAGNIWNFKESYTNSISNNTKFEFKNIGKQIGISAGYGLRFDFTYLVLRTDFGFRFKRPETSNIKNGWKAPDVSFDDIFQKILSKSYRDWRAQNFNFSIGINYPF